MLAATRLFPAILIILGFFLIRTYLYRLPIADVFDDSNFSSLVDAKDDGSTKANEAVELATANAPENGIIQATATVPKQTPATATTLTPLDQIVVIGKLQSEDTSWVEKLPMWVLQAPLILPYTRLTRITGGRMPCMQSTTTLGLCILQGIKAARLMSISRTL